MTQDFAKPSTTKKPGAPKTKKGSSGKSGGAKSSASKKASGASPKEVPSSAPVKNRTPFFLSLIVLVCAFAYGLYFLQSIPPTETPEKQPTISKKSPSASKSTPAEEAPAKRFNFYDILPESTVTAPKVEEYRFKQKSGSEDYFYVIQTGSFKNRADAERQKATIAFKGLKANIETVTNDKGTVWHRVKTGPFTNRSKLNSALDKLVSLNIQPLVKKVKKDS
ncbi:MULTISPECIES: SPOR domain-containing protein [unclassified Oleiphilus]|jgi:hypothetical protein|nr:MULTISPECIES: SPOR domain-containing protein [unclassified Oleiphilus]